MNDMNKNRTEWTSSQTPCQGDRDVMIDDEPFGPMYNLVFDHDEDNLIEAITLDGGELNMANVLYNAEKLYYSYDTISQILEQVPKTGLRAIEQLLCAIYIGRLWEFNARRQAVKVIEDVFVQANNGPDSKLE